MKYLIQLSLAAILIAGAQAYAQMEAPEIRFDSVPNALQLPAAIYLGEVGGVATNSRGDIFVYTRTGHPTVTIGTARPFAHGGSRLFQFDRNGKFVREIGKDSYAFMYAAQVRVDPSDNIWVVDQMTNMVIKFDSQGRVAMLLGRKAENVTVPARAPAGDGSGQPPDLFNRPTDVAWDAAGNIFVADGLGNARIAKFDKDGKFVKSRTGRLFVHTGVAGGRCPRLPEGGEHFRRGVGNAVELLRPNIGDVRDHGPINGDQERIRDGGVQVVNTCRDVLRSFREERQRDFETR
jgi:hypothetical protein